MQPSITHQRGACSGVHRSALIRGEPDISPHRQIKAGLPTTSHPLLPLFTHRLWCGRCVTAWICVCVRCVLGVGGLSLPLNHGGPWGPPQPLRRVQQTPSLPEPQCYLLASSPSLVALITLHVPCPFNLATEGRQVEASPGTGPLEVLIKVPSFIVRFKWLNSQTPPCKSTKKQRHAGLAS